MWHCDTCHVKLLLLFRTDKGMRAVWANEKWHWIQSFFLWKSSHLSDSWESPAGRGLLVMPIHPPLTSYSRAVTGSVPAISPGSVLFGQCPCCLLFLPDTSGVGSLLQNKPLNEAGFAEIIRPSHYPMSPKRVRAGAFWYTLTLLTRITPGTPGIFQDKWWILRGVFYPLVRKSTLKCAKLRKQSLRKNRTLCWPNFKVWYCH